MATRETYYLPGAVLEVDFEGDESMAYDLREFRSELKGKLVKRLIADGVAFEQGSLEGVSDGWRKEQDAVSKLEGAVDAWVLASNFRCTKQTDRRSRKARWALECEEPVTILMVPGGE